MSSTTILLNYLIKLLEWISINVGQKQNSEANTVDLLTLPAEMLNEIFCYLTPKDIISLSLTCKKLRGMTDSDQLWIQACKNEFKISIPSSSNGLAQRFYNRVLKSYGKLLGLWTKSTRVYEGKSAAGHIRQIKDLYGGLLQVTYSDGQIIGFDLLPPKALHLMEPLRAMKLFTISMDESDKGKAVIKCYCSLTPLKHDTCQLFISYKGFLTMQCGTAEQIDGGNFDSYYRGNFLQWMLNQLDPSNYDVFGGMDLHLRNKFDALMQSAVNMMDHSYSKLALPRSISSFLVPIQPGIFKGTYCGCGIQIILLEYVNRRTVRVTKITGDENIRAGKCSFKVDLAAAMYLNEEDQADMEIIEQMDIGPPALTWNELPKSQPFVLPQGCYVDENLVVPDQCQSRFYGSRIIVFHQPSANKIAIMGTGHWIVFNEDLFGFIWISSRKLSLFHRVQESLL